MWLVGHGLQVPPCGLSVLCAMQHQYQATASQDVQLLPACPGVCTQPQGSMAGCISKCGPNPASAPAVHRLHLPGAWQVGGCRRCL